MTTRREELAKRLRHRTQETFAAGVHSYGIRCDDCGELPGRWYTLADVRRAEAQHRRDMKAGKPPGTRPTPDTSL